ncbi:MAG: GNAT family N-acetyltransferase [Nitrospirae bacterium]|nr:GNAT family N-acetyltransferase [Nitrospirota bacterium]
MVTIRRAGEADEQSMRNLFALCFSREMSHDEWYWKYVLSPWGTVAYVGCATRQSDAAEPDAIVSHFGGIRCAFEMHGKRLCAYQFCDVCTHPGYRGRIFGSKPPVMRSAETFYAEREMDFAFGFPSERHARLHCLVLESTYGKVALFRKEFSAKRYVASPMAGLNLLRLQEGWRGFFDGELDDLWMTNTLKPPLTISKGEAYLRWRYQGHPTKKYDVFAWRGLLRRTIRYLAITKMKGDELQVLDFFSTVGGKPIDSCRRVLALLESLARDRGAAALALWLNPGEPLAGLLSGHGYIATDGIPLALKALHPQIMDAGSFYGNYGYRMGDYDDS